MLIQKMLGIYNIDKYFFAEYFTTGEDTRSLLVEVDIKRHPMGKNSCFIEKCYYDVMWERYISSNRMIMGFTKPLTDYVKIDKRYISTKAANKLAETYYGEFEEDISKANEIKYATKTNEINGMGI